MAYICRVCKKTYTKWIGKCDNCGEWNSVEETKISLLKTYKKNFITTNYQTGITQTKKLADLSFSGEQFFDLKTNITEVDNVVGGRFVKGQYVLLAGAPGIGKSTLSLQIIESFYRQGRKILYVSGEESLNQVQVRVERLGINISGVDFLDTRDIYIIIDTLNLNEYDILFIDSIQTVYSPNINSLPGSIAQVCECANLLMDIVKSKNILAFVIGHITKSGDIAGPMYLEHMVDTVLLFEGSKRNEARYLKVIKNRFGPTDEVGIFTMTNKGLVSIKSTLDLLNKDNVNFNSSGVVFTMTVEGNRPIPIEVQALVSKTFFSNPRRTSSGFDLNRLYIIIALLEKRLKLQLSQYDIFVNVVGGIKFDDTGIDLGVLVAIYSSMFDLIVDNNSIFFGEIGLSGEIKKVYMEEKRTKEAEYLGFKNIYSSKTHKTVEGLINSIFKKNK